jgi:energy-coupling factor transport system ATP-binding protein
MLTTKNLSFAYPETEESEAAVVLDQVNITIEEGSFVAIIGHNGSGKSTLAKHFNAILLPTGGKCYVLGMDTSDGNHLFDIRRNVGMVFQNPDNQIVAAVVDEDVAFAPENLGLPREEIVERVEDALAAVGMTEFKNHAPHLLSGGQKQRIAIAGIIAMRPRCIVLDEPTAMLDPRGRKEVLDTLLSLREKYKLTIVLITHHMNEAALAERIIVMNDGQVVLDGTPGKVFAHVDTLLSLGLTVPPSVLLLHELNRLGAGFPEEDMSAKECALAIYDWIKETGKQ